MLTFSKFLLEVARSRPRAQNLLHYVAKRQRASTSKFSITKQVSKNTQIQNLIPVVRHADMPKFINPDNGETVNPQEHSEYYGKPKKVPVRNIITTQSTVQKEVVGKKIQGKWKGHYPEIPHGVIVHAPGHPLHNRIILTDGNHRANAARLQGKEHMMMRVSTVHIHPKHLELYHQMKEIGSWR